MVEGLIPIANTLPAGTVDFFGTQFKTMVVAIALLALWTSTIVYAAVTLATGVSHVHEYCQFLDERKKQATLRQRLEQVFSE
jgi:hypothetical protein